MHNFGSPTDLRMGCYSYLTVTGRGLTAEAALDPNRRAGNWLHILIFLHCSPHDVHSSYPISHTE